MMLLTDEEVDRRLTALGFARAGAYLRTDRKMFVRHIACGGQWMTLPRNLFNRVAGCPYCANGHGALSGRGNRLTHELVDARIRERGFVRAGDYRTNKTPIPWSCLVCSNTWHAAPSDIFKGRGCPDCSAGLNERECRSIMERMTGHRFPQAWPKFLRGLQLDGYCAELRMAFEYDGPQHFRQIEFFTPTRERYDGIVSRDREKDRLCAAHGVLLVRVPFSAKDKEGYIRKQLNGRFSTT